jgi:hypothetical protein
VLRGKHTEPEVKEHEWSFGRTTGRRWELNHRWHSGRHNYEGQVKPWDTRGQTYAHWQGGDPEKNQYVVLYHDAKLDATVERERGRYKAATAEQQELLGYVRSALRAIEAAWLEREEQREYEKFLEDYADPSLWEGHKKLLTIRFPHDLWGNRHFRSGGSRLYDLVSFLVENEIPYDGLTVAEAIEAAGDRRWLRDLDTDAMPEDLLDLRLVGRLDEHERDDEDE